MTISRRRALAAGAATLVGAAAGCASGGRSGGGARVVVVGGGFAGAAAAKALRVASGGAVEVVLVEPAAAFVACPLSDLVLAGQRSIADLTIGYDGLRRHGVAIVPRAATALDAGRHAIGLDDGSALSYQRLVLAPGIDFDFDAIDGLAAAHASGTAPHAWKAGPETLALRRQLEAMPDGGVFVIVIPELPIRCPPAPYERACLVAGWLAANKPRAKVLVLDANPDIAAEPALFRRAFRELHPGRIEYRPQTRVVGVVAGSAAAGGVLKLEVDDDVRGDVLNVLPPMRAGAIARDAGLATINRRWCPVDFLTFESTVAPDIHVVGDAIQGASAMPKSAHVAVGQARVAAAAVLARLAGRDIDPAPTLESACYSFVAAGAAIRFAATHRYDPQQRTYVTEPSAARPRTYDAAAADAALQWSRQIRADAFD